MHTDEEENEGQTFDGDLHPHLNPENPKTHLMHADIT